MIRRKRKYKLEIFSLFMGEKNLDSNNIQRNILIMKKNIFKLENEYTKMLVFSSTKSTFILYCCNSFKHPAFWGSQKTCLSAFLVFFEACLPVKWWTSHLQTLPHHTKHQRQGGQTEHSDWQNYQ